MKLSTSFLALAASLTAPALAAVGGYGQCGGTGYSGDTTCVSGFTCTYSNDWYSQCIPGSAGSTTASSSTTKSTTTTTSTSTTATSTTATSITSTSAPPSSTGFVKTSGQKFTLNGKTFTLVGSNSYWVGLQGLTTAQMNQAFADIAKTGATTVRTWGFNDVTATSGWAYYQLWNGKTATVNTGALGLGNFDNVVAAAKANGLRLIVALTNNWSDYGGMDVYTKQITGSANHDVFYTDSNVQAAYKSYISTFVGRYKNEPTILAWELANEPRCKGSTAISSGTCTTSTLTSWIKSASAYIKSIDSNHLVAVGDEGFFNQPGAPTYPYQGSEGIDFTANLAVSTIDFGTFHMYPEPWGQSANVTGWGTQWIIDHASAQKTANKPVILEEFGAKSDQAATYTTWLNTVVSSGLTGDLIWQAGSKLSGYTSPDDGYAVYPDGAVYPVVTKHAAALKARG